MPTARCQRVGEWFDLLLSAPTGATPGDDNARATIIDEQTDEVQQ